MRDRIMDAAEARMRAGGYNAVSFRDIANDVGVKSASVHYHFPTKEDLGVALVERYSERVFEAVAADAPEGASPAASVRAMAGVYCGAFVEGKSICLCAMLSAESVGLPDRVVEAVKAFHEKSLDWLRAAFAGETAAEARAAAVFAVLQGGLLVAAVNRDGAYMERAAAGALALADAPFQEG